jgi:methionyl-tRNA synthetase
MAEQLVVLVPRPNANGDLHLGHLSGPFLAADVFTRYARAAGRQVLFGSGVQDTQTYVVTTAHRLGIGPRELAACSTNEVATTLDLMGIAVDGFVVSCEEYRRAVLGTLEPLYSAGRLLLRPVPLPYLEHTGEYLVDAYVRGSCPVCLIENSAGLCENCGHPIPAGELVGPWSPLYPDQPVRLREVPILVLPLGEYRDQLHDHLGRCEAGMRPHMIQAIREIMSRPLADLPITQPGSWGIPAPFPEVPGQVINPMVEAVGWSMYGAALSAEHRGRPLSARDELWLPGAGSRVVYFHGFDNLYAFAIAGVALLLAHDGRYALPEWFITNELYELDNEKFSTSRGHAVWGRDLVAELPRDLVRYYLALTSPELQRTSFSRDAMTRVTESLLVNPWNRIADEVDSWVGRTLPVSERSRAAAARIVAQFAASYELPYFSLHRTAHTLTAQLDRLDWWTVQPGDAGDFCHEVEVVLRCAAPVLIDLADQATVEPEIPPDPGVTEIIPRRLPRLRSKQG